MQTTTINWNLNRVGFDFDGVLDKPFYQFLAHYMIGIGKQVYVITKRLPDEGIEHGADEPYQITDSLRIPRERVLFTSDNIKSPFILLEDIQLFFDDEQANLDDINSECPETQTILVN